ELLDAGGGARLGAAMTYDPFSRGEFPVGVHTWEATDGGRNRPLPIEIWYPATDAHRGQDVSDAGCDHYEMMSGFPALSQEAVRGAAPRTGGRYPLVLFSHGFGGHRRQSTFLCTHLASHGYVVAAVDHTGNTSIDMMQLVMQAQSGGPPPDPAGMISAFIGARPLDVLFML